MPQWIKFKLIKKPFWDGSCQILASIEGRRNRKGIDEFTGGGKVYPDLSKVLVLEQYQKGTNLLVLVDGEQADIDALLKQEAVTFKASPKELKTDLGGFQPAMKTDAEVKAIKVDVFGIKEVLESGVTP